MIQGLKISPKHIAIFLIFVVLVITALSIGGQYFREGFTDNEFAMKVIGKLNLDEEKNSLPTWYQSSTLLLSSFLLLVISLVRRELKDKDAKFWGLLSVIFLFLSLDESISIHEQMTMPLRTAFNLEGFLFLSWVIPASLLMAVFAAVFVRFLFRLPAFTRYLMITAGLIFLSGAVGLEMAGANYMFSLNNPDDIGNNFTYALITTFEELLEMSGIVLFLYTLLEHLFNPRAAEVPAVNAAKAGFQTTSDSRVNA